MEFTDEQVQREADRLIAAAAAKHGLATIEVPQDVKDKGLAEARALLESNARGQSSEDYKALFEASEQRAKLAEQQLAAVRNSRNVARDDARPVETAEGARAKMGKVAWFKLSEAGKIAAIGQDPAKVDTALARRLFGRGADTAAASDLFKRSPLQYRQLREVARALEIA